MDRHIDETRHVTVSLDKFEKNKRYKEQIIQEITVAICAMLNTKGGKVVILSASDSNDAPAGGSSSSQMSSLIRIVEQFMISIIGLHETITNINFIDDNESVLILVKKADSLITTNYNLYLPSQSQVVLVSPLERPEKVKEIMNRKVILEPVQIGSHNKIFRKDSTCDIHESKTVQLKHLKAHATKRTTLADRMIGKGNKFTCYVSAFANYIGGHIYYGNTDKGIVVGELIRNEEDQSKIIKKVEKAIKKMIWPAQISQPKRGEHWDIFFEPVVDEGNKPIPSTFVIVIFIAACVGGVFTKEPECYEMVEKQVKKMSFIAWKKRMLLPGQPCCREEIRRSIQRIKWSSPKARQSFATRGEKLRKFISNGDWNAFLKECEILLETSTLCEMLLILSKQITACYRRGQFNKACNHLVKYEEILPRAEDQPIFEVLKLYLEAALSRASGNIQALKEPLSAALSKAELIEPGLVPAIVYVFAATVADLIYSDEPGKMSSPDYLSRRALEHLRCLPDSSDVRADMEQKVHMTLATYHLGCNMNGQCVKDYIDISDLEKAKDSITVVNKSFYSEGPRTKYRECQFNFVLSLYHYRQSQVIPEEKVRYLRNAFSYAEKTKAFATELGFTEMVEWSKTHKACCAEALVRSKFRKV